MTSDLLALRWDEAARGSGSRGSQMQSENVYIAVMGVTGSGKSSFIARCSGKPVRIGHGLNGCTTTVDVFEYDVSTRRRVYLIDTPGFDDTSRSDAEVLKEIATWLGDSYKNKILLNGIIYLHRITDRRMPGSARRNLLLFRQLCGQDCLKKVVLVTTMWDQVSDEVFQEAQDRETELTTTMDFWGWMVKNGSSVHRHNHTKSSAARIIQTLANHSQPFATDLQKELVDQKRRLGETSAGREIQSDLMHQKNKLTGEYHEMGEKLKEAEWNRDVLAEEMLREERTTSAGNIERMDEAISSLRSTMDTLILERDERVKRVVEEQLRKRDASYNDELEQRLQRLEVEKEQALEKQSDKAAERHSLTTLVTAITPTESLQDGGSYMSTEKSAAEKTSPQPQPRPFQALRMPQDSSVASVSLCGDVVCVIGDCSVNSSEYPKLKLGTAYLRTISLGDASEGSRSWIGRYEKVWMTSENLGKVYPELAQGIRLHGLQTLKCCFLGPDKQYFAQWQDGYDQYSSPINFSAVLEGRNHVVDVAFGCEHTYFINYVAPGSKHLYFYDLKGYYEDLCYFLSLRENKKIIILAITLDPSNTTDYILVYTFNKLLASKKERKVHFKCSEANATLVSSFWQNTLL
ncbi:hypothetical protein S7711_06105 [Stachybotrys chartarum IBT 7711]|uniref:G domain-containing protein n=1 Tax=Stachybotrys chartarum (strain CBS 109288 / IBT 7711) TaxID=1280523 RepID=A0A084B8L9_STACB|nr:hypothetical protein S7711_06105 [Stachybotrys chartarum IBT 7711]KFA80901.1 hypothetical protein S40288_07986 [Stachybotrys chartarum IBT 40288]